MKVTKRKEEKYPTLATFTDGTKVIIPKQSKFSNGFLRQHGCSIMAEYVALQWQGIKKIGKKTLYPLYILDWHKANTKSEVRAKVTLRGVAKGINAIGKDAKYYKVVTYGRIRKALNNGYLVIMEQGNPIHSITLVKDGGVDYIINYGNVKKVDVAKIAKTATKNSTYRGMVVVKR